MKFKRSKRTANNFIIGRWYKGKGHYRQGKWKVVEHRKISLNNNYQYRSLFNESNVVYCYPNDYIASSGGWNLDTVVCVHINDIDKNS